MKAEIHNLEERFLSEIILIENASFSHPWSEDAYKKEIDNEMAVYKVITLDNQVCAYGGFWQIFDEGHITNIAVKEEFRKQGFGKMLMDSLILEAKERQIRSMTLEVRTSNTGAIRLYENCSFKSVGIRKGYYPDGENALIMWLEEIC